MATCAPCAALFAAALLPSAALAHEPQAAAPQLWSLDPLVWVPLAVNRAS